MNIRRIFGLPVMLAFTFAIFASAAQGSVIGDFKDTKEGVKQALKCNYDEAFEKLDTAIAEGGFAGEMAVIEKAVVLLDADREKEAWDLMAERSERLGSSEEDIAESEKSVKEALENLRTERKKETGSRTCP